MAYGTSCINVALRTMTARADHITMDPDDGIDAKLLVPAAFVSDHHDYIHPGFA